MNRISHRIALLGGLAIILVVNAIALGGAAWNRSGEDSRLQLTERELSVPWQSYDDGDDEDSGIALELNWQTDTGYERGGSKLLALNRGSDARWLDAGKLAELGFVLRPPTVRELEKQSWRGRQRDVVAVVEMDGPAHARALAQAVRDVEDRRAELAKAPTDAGLKGLLDDREKALLEVREESSRLYVVDAGLDRAELRRKYPDRRRYALMPALVSMHWVLDKGQMQVRAGVSKLIDDQLHLSNTLASAITPAFAPQRRAYDATKEPIEVDLRIGRRLEPWVASAKLRQPAKR